MIITNKFGLPQPVVSAIEHDSYSPGDADISVTSLINPPRIATLLKRYGDALSEDASDRIWSLLGQAVHEILHRANTTGIAEKRLYMDVDGWRVSGQFDRIEYFADRGLLQDYKCTSVWAIKYGGRDEWTPQLNLYRLLCAKNGYPIHDIEVVAILRDWRPSEFDTMENYPRSQIITLPIELWPLDKTEAYVHERVALHRAARKELPFCSDEDRWLRNAKWALMRQGKKKAVKLYPFRELAMMAAKADPKLYIEERPGRFMRCASYCAAASVCLSGDGDMRQLSQAEIETKELSSEV